MVVGAGHAGLAVSHFLTSRSIDHVVIERGEVANTWRTERWDSLRLLTPNWQSRLPGMPYSGDDSDGFMTMPEVVDLIGGYAKLIDAPLQLHTTVSSVRRHGDGYRVVTDQGTWDCPTIVIASGGFNLPKVPAIEKLIPDSVQPITPQQYRSPDQLAEREVLVVGAAATGVQIADEVLRSGRPVTISVGEHVRMPRVYRGKDVQWWIERSGLADERFDEVDDLVRARHVASPQLVGTPERATLDLNALMARGASLVGRFAGVVGRKAQFSGSLRNVCNLADLKQQRMLTTFDDWSAESGTEGEVGPPERYPPTRIARNPPLNVDLDAFGTIIWATGFIADHTWLEVPVVDQKGRIRHNGGVVADAPGMYRVGLTFLRRRKSSFIYGAEDDARDIVSHLAAYLREAHTGRSH